MGENAVELARLAAEVQTEITELEFARETLVQIVHAKRSGNQDLGAWANAFEIADAMAARASPKPPTSLLRCTECRALLVVADIEVDGATLGTPLRIHCGPEHVLDFASGSLTISVDGSTFARSVVTPMKVFGESEVDDA